MCAVDDAEPATVFEEWTRCARVAHVCGECARTIRPGEVYQVSSGLWDGRWSTFKTCAHCTVLGAWLGEICGGYPFGALTEELREHWRNGYASVALGRLIVAQRRGWRGGDDPVPSRGEVVELARRMLRAVTS